MPKVIKRKAAKPDAAEEGLQNILGQLQEKAQQRKRLLLVWGGAVLAAIVLVAGFFWYRASTMRQAESHAYQGYRTLSGLYEESAATGKQERIRKALESFTKAYELRPGPYSLYYIGVCQADLGDYASAEASLGKVVAEYPNDTRFVPVALYRMGLAQISSGKNDEALRTFERFKQIGIQAMGDLALVESARLLERMGRKEESLNKYRALILEFPGSTLSEEAKAAVAAAERAAGGGMKSDPLGQTGFAPQLDIQPMAIPLAPPAEKK